MIDVDRACTQSFYEDPRFFPVSDFSNQFSLARNYPDRWRFFLKKSKRIFKLG